MQNKFFNVHRVIEGFFDGRDMKGDDGQIYYIPPNYASKSRLVVGDRMKCNILEDGRIIFKNIQPAERIKFIGHIVMYRGALAVEKDNKFYKVNEASLRFFKVNEGDEVVAITSKDADYCAIDQRMPGQPTEEEM